MIKVTPIEVSIEDAVNHFADTVSLIVMVGTVVDYLPPIAAAFSILWSIVRIYETETVQNIVRFFFPRKGKPNVPPKVED